MGARNLGSINLAFPYLALRSQNISNEIFAPNLVNRGIPTKEQRGTALLIISSLGFDSSQILSKPDILRLKKDISFLTETDSGKTGRECLVELGIWDEASQEANLNQLQRLLLIIKENRGKVMNYSRLKQLSLSQPNHRNTNV